MASYYCNSNMADQGAARDEDDFVCGPESLKEIIDFVGTTNKATIIFEARSVAQTTYTLTTSESVPANIQLRIENGAVWDGAGTLTLDNLGQIVANPDQQIYGSSITVVYTNGGSIDYPKRWGAPVDGTNNDGTAINRMAEACRDNAIPIHFHSGNYYTTVSLNFSGSNNDNAVTMGWTITGDGPGSTTITGNLASGYPIVDMTDDEQTTLSGIRIEGDSGGSQLCGILHGMVGAGLALENKLYNVLIGGTYAEAGYICCGADLTRIDHSYIYGPIGTLFTADKDALGAGVIQSLYNTLYASGEGTQNHITNSSVIGAGGDTNSWDSAVVMDEIEKLSIKDSYIAQDGVAKAGIYVTGTTGNFYDVHRLDFISSRYENQTDVPANGCFLWVNTVNHLRDSVLEGVVGGNGVLPDLGRIIYLEAGNIENSKIKLASAAAIDWAHFVERSSSQVITNCEIWEQTASGTMLDGTDAACFGIGNVIHLRDWNAAWAAVADRNTFFTSDKGMVVIDSTTGFNSIGTSTSLARKFVGVEEVSYQATATTAGAGDETLDSYTLPGDICYGSIVSDLATLRIKAFGYVSSDANAKSIEGKFGVSGSETSIITNDITGSPNGDKWEITAEVIRFDLTTGWVYNCTMTVGAVTQTTTVGTVSADPDVDSVKFLITGNAGADEIVLQMFKVEIF